MTMLQPEGPTPFDSASFAVTLPPGAAPFDDGATPRRRGERVPPTLADRADVEALEKAAARQSESYLEMRVTLLERLARAAAIASGPRAGDGASAWRPGGRDFKEAFVSEPLGDFYVQRSRIAQREMFLASSAHFGRDHEFIDWLACIPPSRRERRHRLLDEYAWRGLFDFDDGTDDGE